MRKFEIVNNNDKTMGIVNANNETEAWKKFFDYYESQRGRNDLLILEISSKDDDDDDY